MGNQHRIFVSSCASGAEGAIIAFDLDAETGRLEQVNRYDDIEGPFYLALAPDRAHLYSTHAPSGFEGGDGMVAAFAIDSESGALRKLNEQSAAGTTTCYVDVDPTGKALVFANYSSGSVGAFPIGADGSLGEISSFVQHEGGSVDPGRQEGPHAHCSVISPDGRHMLACDLGTDQIFCYALDAAAATLTPLAQPYVRTIGGGGPRHLTFHPRGFVYANNEMGNSVNVYRYDTDAGTLIELQVIPTLPGDFEGDSYTADTKVGPNGRFVYTTNRRHDSIAIYSVGDDGRLALVEMQPSLGTFAQNLAFTPDGGLLLCANMTDESEARNGENLVVFRVDAATGKLTPAGEPVRLANPSCIMIV